MQTPVKGSAYPVTPDKGTNRIHSLRGRNETFAATHHNPLEIFGGIPVTPINPLNTGRIRSITDIHETSSPLRTESPQTSAFSAHSSEYGDEYTPIRKSLFALATEGDADQSFEDSDEFVYCGRKPIWHTNGTALLQAVSTGGFDSFSGFDFRTNYAHKDQVILKDLNATNEPLIPAASTIRMLDIMDSYRRSGIFTSYITSGSVSRMHDSSNIGTNSNANDDNNLPSLAQAKRIDPIGGESPSDVIKYEHIALIDDYDHVCIGASLSLPIVVEPLLAELWNKASSIQQQVIKPSDNPALDCIRKLLCLYSSTLSFAYEKSTDIEIHPNLPSGKLKLLVLGGSDKRRLDDVVSIVIDSLISGGTNDIHTTLNTPTHILAYRAQNNSLAYISEVLRNGDKSAAKRDVIQLLSNMSAYNTKVRPTLDKLGKAVQSLASDNSLSWLAKLDSIREFTSTTRLRISSAITEAQAYSRKNPGASFHSTWSDCLSWSMSELGRAAETYGWTESISANEKSIAFYLTDAQSKPFSVAPVHKTTGTIIVNVDPPPAPSGIEDIFLEDALQGSFRVMSAYKNDASFLNEAYIDNTNDIDTDVPINHWFFHSENGVFPEALYALETLEGMTHGRFVFSDIYSIKDKSYEPSPVTNKHQRNSNVEPIKGGIRSPLYWGIIEALSQSTSVNPRDPMDLTLFANVAAILLKGTTLDRSIVAKILSENWKRWSAAQLSEDDIKEVVKKCASLSSPTENDPPSNIKTRGGGVVLSLDFVNQVESISDQFMKDHTVSHGQLLLLITSMRTYHMSSYKIRVGTEYLERVIESVRKQIVLENDDVSDNDNDDDIEKHPLFPSIKDGLIKLCTRKSRGDGDIHARSSALDLWGSMIKDVNHYVKRLDYIISNEMIFDSYALAFCVRIIQRALRPMYSVTMESFVESVYDGDDIGPIRSEEVVMRDTETYSSISECLSRVLCSIQDIHVSVLPLSGAPLMDSLHQLVDNVPTLRTNDVSNQFETQTRLYLQSKRTNESVEGMTILTTGAGVLDLNRFLTKDITWKQRFSQSMAYARDQNRKSAMEKWRDTVIDGNVDNDDSYGENDNSDHDEGDIIDLRTKFVSLKLLQDFDALYNRNQQNPVIAQSTDSLSPHTKPRSPVVISKSSYSHISPQLPDSPSPGYDRNIIQLRSGLWDASEPSPPSAQIATPAATPNPSPLSSPDIREISPPTNRINNKKTRSQGQTEFTSNLLKDDDTAPLFIAYTPNLVPLDEYKDMFQDDSFDISQYVTNRHPLEGVIPKLYKDELDKYDNAENDISQTALRRYQCAGTVLKAVVNACNVSSTRPHLHAIPDKIINDKIKNLRENHSIKQSFAKGTPGRNGEEDDVDDDDILLSYVEREFWKSFCFPKDPIDDLFDHANLLYFAQRMLYYSNSIGKFFASLHNMEKVVYPNLIAKQNPVLHRLLCVEYGVDDITNHCPWTREERATADKEIAQRLQNDPRTIHTTEDQQFQHASADELGEFLMHESARASRLLSIDEDYGESSFVPPSLLKSMPHIIRTEPDESWFSSVINNSLTKDDSNANSGSVFNNFTDKHSNVMSTLDQALSIVLDMFLGTASPPNPLHIHRSSFGFGANTNSDVLTTNLKWYTPPIHSTPNALPAFEPGRLMRIIPSHPFPISGNGYVMWDHITLDYLTCYVRMINVAQLKLLLENTTKLVNPNQLDSDFSITINKEEDLLSLGRILDRGTKVEFPGVFNTINIRDITKRLANNGILYVTSSKASDIGSFILEPLSHLRRGKMIQTGPIDNKYGDMIGIIPFREAKTTGAQFAPVGHDKGDRDFITRTILDHIFTITDQAKAASKILVDAEESYKGGKIVDIPGEGYRSFARRMVESTNGALLKSASKTIGYAGLTMCFAYQMHVTAGNMNSLSNPIDYNTIKSKYFPWFDIAAPLSSYKLGYNKMIVDVDEDVYVQDDNGNRSTSSAIGENDSEEIQTVSSIGMEIISVIVRKIIPAISLRIIRHLHDIANKKDNYTNQYKMNMARALDKVDTLRLLINDEIGTKWIAMDGDVINSAWIRSPLLKGYVSNVQDLLYSSKLVHYLDSTDDSGKAKADDLGISESWYPIQWIGASELQDLLHVIDLKDILMRSELVRAIKCVKIAYELCRQILFDVHCILRENGSTIVNAIEWENESTAAKGVIDHNATPYRAGIILEKIYSGDAALMASIREARLVNRNELHTVHIMFHLASMATKTRIHLIDTKMLINNSDEKNPDVGLFLYDLNATIPTAPDSVQKPFWAQNPDNDTAGGYPIGITIAFWDLIRENDVVNQGTGGNSNSDTNARDKLRSPTRADVTLKDRKKTLTMTTAIDRNAVFINFSSGVLGYDVDETGYTNSNEFNIYPMTGVPKPNQPYRFPIKPSDAFKIITSYVDNLKDISNEIKLRQNSYSLDQKTLLDSFPAGSDQVGGMLVPRYHVNIMGKLFGSNILTNPLLSVTTSSFTVDGNASFFTSENGEPDYLDSWVKNLQKGSIAFREQRDSWLMTNLYPKNPSDYEGSLPSVAHFFGSMFAAQNKVRNGLQSEPWEDIFLEGLNEYYRYTITRTQMIKENFKDQAALLLSTITESNENQYPCELDEAIASGFITMTKSQVRIALGFPAKDESITLAYMIYIPSLRISTNDKTKGKGNKSTPSSGRMKKDPITPEEIQKVESLRASLYGNSYITVPGKRYADIYSSQGSHAVLAELCKILVDGGGNQDGAVDNPLELVLSLGFTPVYIQCFIDDGGIDEDGTIDDPWKHNSPDEKAQLHSLWEYRPPVAVRKPLFGMTSRFSELEPYMNRKVIKDNVYGIHERDVRPIINLFTPERSIQMSSLESMNANDYMDLVNFCTYKQTIPHMRVNKKQVNKKANTLRPKRQDRIASDAYNQIISRTTMTTPPKIRSEVALHSHNPFLVSVLVSSSVVFDRMEWIQNYITSTAFGKSKSGAAIDLTDSTGSPRYDNDTYEKVQLEAMHGIKSRSPKYFTVVVPTYEHPAMKRFLLACDDDGMTLEDDPILLLRNHNNATKRTYPRSLTLQYAHTLSGYGKQVCTDDSVNFRIQAMVVDFVRQFRKTIPQSDDTDDIDQMTADVTVQTYISELDTGIKTFKAHSIGVLASIRDTFCRNLLAPVGEQGFIGALESNNDFLIACADLEILALRVSVFDSLINYLKHTQLDDLQARRRIAYFYPSHISL